jgi:hypothetical protein
MIPEGNPEEKGNSKASLCPKSETISLPSNGGLQGSRKTNLSTIERSSPLPMLPLDKSTRGFAASCFEAAATRVSATGPSPLGG